MLAALIFAYLKASKSFKSPDLFVILTFLLMTVLGILISSRASPQKKRKHFSNHYEPGSILEIKILEKLKNNDFYNRYLGEIIGVDQLRSEGEIMIRISNKDSLKQIQFDEKLLTSEKLVRFKEPLNPGEFNFKEYAKRKGLIFQLSLEKGSYIVTKDKQLGIRSKCLILRERILKSLIKQDFSPDEFMVIEALLLGRKEDLAKEITEKYKNAGAMHILAISGLHIGILLMIFNTLLKPIENIRHGKKVKLALLLLFLWFFALLSGLSPSVIRAVLMFSILSIGIVAKRSSNLDHYLFISLFLSLLSEPLFIFDLGFQLSYVALISIIGIGPIIKNLWTPRHKVLRYFWELFVVSFAAQLGILPLSLYYFHQFSGVFILSSLFVIPMLGIVLGGGYLMIFLDQIKYLPKIYVGIYSKLIESMNSIIGFIGRIEPLIYRDVYFNLVLAILCYVLICFVVKFIKNRSIDHFVRLCFCGMILFSFLLFDYKMGQTKSNFIVFNQYKESLFFNRSGNAVTIYSNPDNKTAQFYKTIENFSKEHLNLTLNQTNSIKHFYKFHNKRIMVIDHESIKSDFGFEPDILILIKSPKINLNRLIMKIQPSVIIADGSNYQTYKSLWKKSAKAAGVLFHDTSNDGAFILSKES